jgi:uncharacterized protein YgbK (DUF1537 family)
MTTRLGCIADDFTGATDLAGLLARSGHPVSLASACPRARRGHRTVRGHRPQVPDRTGRGGRGGVSGSTGWLQAAGATQAFWKYCSTFDSTAEGNIGPVAEALMGTSARRRRSIAPPSPKTVARSSWATSSSGVSRCMKAR